MALRIALLALLLLLPVLGSAQPAAPCSAPEARQLDFWLGEWELSWSGGTGTNSITRRYGDCVIQEDFSGNMPNGLFLGSSFSVYDARRGVWRQTWVDNNGGYLVFTGGLDDGGIMRLYGERGPAPEGGEQITRMSWLDVTDDGFDWHWERSLDDGATWQLVWAIRYDRRGD